MTWLQKELRWGANISIYIFTFIFYFNIFPFIYLNKEPTFLSDYQYPGMYC